MRFPLSSDQLELLLAFEQSEGLNHLANLMAKDPSVVSRGLQRIAEEFPVLAKVKGRWELTELGRQTNLVTLELIEKQNSILQDSIQKLRNKNLSFNSKSVLVVINAQCGLIDATQLGRNNLEAEQTISRLLSFWREKKWPVIHVRHVSENPQSLFYRQGKGCDFLPGLEPLKSEIIIDKIHSSGFSKTDLEERLKNLESQDLILTGFTTNECIDATARDSASLGFSTFVVEDGTALFDLRGSNGKLIKADRLHKLTMANLSAFYAQVIRSEMIL